MRALIVEDDFGSRHLLQAYLKDLATVDVAVDGEEGMEAFRLAWSENDPYDLILLDIMMPKKDGQTCLKEIREIEREMGVRTKDEVPVIMTTALEDPKNVIEAFHKGGATGYIVKPIDKNTFLAEIEKHLSH
jgi:two-component system chemotaxis response regulator CheY